MQKVWKQIGLYRHIWDKLEAFGTENNILTDGAIIIELIHRLERYQNIMKELEKQAHESEIWKERAEAHLKPAKKVKE